MPTPSEGFLNGSFSDDEFLKKFQAEFQEQVRRKLDNDFRNAVLYGRDLQRRTEMSTYTLEHLKSHNFPGIISGSDAISSAIHGVQVVIVETMKYGEIKLVDGDRRRVINILEG